VALYDSSTIQRFLAERIETMGRPPARPRVQGNSFEAVCLMADAGVGVGVVPGSVARRLASTLRIRAVPLSDPWALRKRYVVSRELATRPQYVHVRDLVRAIRDAASASD
jgi:DNA-binding transcriptional LysR family regulator